jgi:hypothetical protein
MQRLSLQVAAEFLDGKKRGGVKMWFVDISGV